MNLKKILLTIPILSIVTGVSGCNMAAENRVNNAENQFVLYQDVEWQPLNPARGNMGPQAGMLWGNITQDTASGILVKFAEGFASPAHIHNITYRAVVISGSVHNDDPNAEKMWMGPGSFWIQPAGEAHVTAENGGNTMIFLEIQTGPYLVEPVQGAFDNGERPVNLEERNIVWLDSSDVTWVANDLDSQTDTGVKISFLWGSPVDGEVSGSFVKLPAGYKGEIESNSENFRVVTIAGNLGYETSNELENLEPGSMFFSTELSSHRLNCASENDCIIYVRTDGEYRVSSD